MNGLENLAVAYLEAHGETLKNDYDGFCGELANEVSKWLDKAVDILYVEPARYSYVPWLHEDEEGNLWKFHIVPVIDGIVHDAWHPSLLLPPEEYVVKAFPKRTLELMINGELPGWTLVTGALAHA